MKRRRKNSDTPKILALTAALALCIGGLGYAGFQSVGIQVADKYGCYEGESKGQTLVFVDSSQPRWNEVQQRSLINYFDTLYGSLRFGQKLSIYTTEGDRVTSGVPKASFHVCGPASSAEELKAVGGAEASAGYLRKVKQRLYENVLAPELEALLTLNPDKARLQLHQSPILELIQALSRQLRPGDKLVTISDMIQNSDSMRACRVKGDLPRYSTFKTRPFYQRRLKPESLDGVEVEVLMLQRVGYTQGELKHCREDELQRFWDDYFTDNGAVSPHVIRVRHGYTDVAQ